MEPARPESTAAIVLAASRFPKFKQIDTPSVETSARAMAEYLRSPGGLYLPDQNIFEAIDDPTSSRPNQLFDQIEAFVGRLRQRTGSALIRDLLFYYVGHGDHVAPDGAYHLFLPETDEQSIHSTSLSVAALSEVLARHASGWRRYMIIDACFAGAARRLFDSSLMGRLGTNASMLCASSADQRALAPRGERYTVFSGSLLTLLWRGVDSSDESLNLRFVADELTARIRQQHGAGTVVPEIHSLAGEASDVPLFPNRVQRNPGVSQKRRLLYERSDGAEFHGEMELLMRRASRLVFMGMGVNILQRDALAHEVIARAANGDCSLEVYLADPDSQDIQARLIEEELGAYPPNVGERGLRSRLAGFSRMWLANHRPPSVKIQTFPHSPAFALIIADGEHFIYPYGCRMLGNHSPVLRFSAHRPEDAPMVSFLQRHYEHVKTSSVCFTPEASQREPQALRDHGLALYFIPPKGSALYQFGTQFLGYDIWNRTALQGDRSKFSGSAGNFGFHLTIADALYFRSHDQVRLMIEQIKFALHGIGPFDLSDLRLGSDTPGPGILSLTARDTSGRLEALHHECVFRWYRRAIASNYTLGAAQLRGESELGNRRDEFLLSRFKVPYILKAFRPHFTLQTGVPTSERESALKQAAALYHGMGCPSGIRVHEVQIVTHDPNEERWHVMESVRLEP